MIKRDDRTEQGISICEEILKETESTNLSIFGILRKILRLASLLNKEEEFSWVKYELEGPREHAIGYHERIINSIHKIITKQWMELRFEGIIETIFTDTKKLVDSKLVEICPDATVKFTSAYERLRETNPESWAQAVTTCRRILKDFADAIYPSTHNTINGRKLGDEQYINRLWAFASEKIESKSNKELTKSEVDYLGQRIDTLYDLTCRGTHAEISKDEAERVIIRTYLLIGDLIKLGDL